MFPLGDFMLATRWRSRSSSAEVLEKGRGDGAGDGDSEEPFQRRELFLRCDLLNIVKADQQFIIAILNFWYFG